MHGRFKSSTLHIPLIHVFLVRDCTRDCLLLDVWELPAVLEPAADPDMLFFAECCTGCLGHHCYCPLRTATVCTGKTAT